MVGVNEAQVRDLVQHVVLMKMAQGRMMQLLRANANNTSESCNQ